MSTEDDEVRDRDRAEPPPADEAVAEGAAATEEFAEDAPDLRHLLRGALLRDEPEIPDVLRGVQRKLRRRSGGKFFSDAWSTDRQPPTQTYLVTTLVMLAIVIAIWAVLYPISGAAIPVDPLAPVNVLPPR